MDLAAPDLVSTLKETVCKNLFIAERERFEDEAMLNPRYTIIVVYLRKNDTSPEKQESLPSLFRTVLACVLPTYLESFVAILLAAKRLYLFETGRPCI